MHLQINDIESIKDTRGKLNETAEAKAIEKIAEAAQCRASKIIRPVMAGGSQNSAFLAEWIGIALSRFTGTISTILQ